MAKECACGKVICVDGQLVRVVENLPWRYAVVVEPVASDEMKVLRRFHVSAEVLP